MIHMSRDPWRKTNSVLYFEKLATWEREGDTVLLASGQRSAIGGHEINELKERFAGKLHAIDLGSASRFGMVYDPEKHILLVQLTDDKKLRVYQGPY